MKTPIQDHYFLFGIRPGSVCCNCKNRSGNFKQMPEDCMTCGYQDHWDKPFTSLSPVWNEDGTPSNEDSAAAFRICEDMAFSHPDLRVDDMKALLKEQGVML